jgi:chromosome segregation ATPase
MLSRFILLCTAILVMGTGCAGPASVARDTIPSQDPALGLLNKRITQLTVNLNGLSKRMSESPPMAAEGDSMLQELRELDRSGWQLHQKQWALQRDYLVFSRDQLERAQKSPGDKPQLLEQWRRRRQEYMKALEELRQQRQQLEQQHQEVEARLVERGLQ